MSEKKCEVCLTQIPESFGNALCLECYGKLEKEQRTKEEYEKEEREDQGKEEPTPYNSVQEPEPKPAIEIKENPDRQLKEKDSSITDERYRENIQMDDKPQWAANIVQFDKSGKLLWNPTRDMYTFVKEYIHEYVKTHPQFPKHIWQPHAVDVGCGSGVGTNVLSSECSFTWGIDKNLKSVQFAKEAFTREKNNIYYTPQVSFDHIDIMEDTREFQKFDVVVAIEVIEHVDDWRGFLEKIIRFAKKDKDGKYHSDKLPNPTTFFISSPNRNNKNIKKEYPQNKYHVREWTSEEMLDSLSEYFTNVQLRNSVGEHTSRETNHTPILAQCAIPKI